MKTGESVVVHVQTAVGETAVGSHGLVICYRNYDQPRRTISDIETTVGSFGSTSGGPRPNPDTRGATTEGGGYLIIINIMAWCPKVAARPCRRSGSPR
eukprot:COSAG05_NODE_598_length_8448_cov_204.560786_1_plen_98_part_00